MTLPSRSEPQESWLQLYLQDSVRRDVCIRINCTTCGASEFRRGLLAALAEATGGPVALRMDHDVALALSRELPNVHPAADPRCSLEGAVRLIIYEIWFTLGPQTLEEHIEPILTRTWAGSVLTRMKEHYQARMEALSRHAEENDPERVKQRREEKRQLKQEKHVERLDQQRDRARAWHGTHGSGGE